MLNLAEAENMVSANVASREIQRNQEHARQRYLSEAEVSRLFEALDGHSNRTSAAALKVLLLTGARKSEVLGMRWCELDLNEGIWIKPPARTKQRKSHRVPLADAVVKILRELKEGQGSEYVFPSNSAGGHLTEIKRSWSSVSRTAEIKDCRIHDLRHSFASIVASKGGSLATIGALLGHSQAQTTQRYTHLFDTTLRSAAELVAGLLARA